MERIFRVDFYPNEWLVDTSLLTPEQRGIYIQLVALIYAKRGPIDDNAKWLAGHCGCSTRLVTTIVAQLAQLGFIQIEGGKIGQKRAEKELNMKRTHLQVSANGGRTTAENRRQNNNNNELPSTDTPNPVPTSKAKATAIAKSTPPTPKGGQADADLLGSPAGKKDEPAIAMPHTGALPPPAWGNWALQAFTVGRVRIEEEWAIFRDHWTVGKGKKTRRTEHGWEMSWRSWTRKSFSGMERGPGGGQPPGSTSAAHNPQARQVGAGAETL